MLNTGSLTISMKEFKRLKKLILELGLKSAPTKSDTERMRIKDGEISIIVYKSGKLVHNGTQASLDLIRTILQQETQYDFILGSDETGKGEWYGPLVVEAVALTPEDIVKFRELGVRDSKTIKRKHLLGLGEKFAQLKFPRRLLIFPPHTYNLRYDEFRRENKTLNDMLAWAHVKVIDKLLNQIKFKKAKVIIDKFDIKKTDLRLGRVSIDTNRVDIIQKSRGESEIPVAVASVLAKYVFEQEVDTLNKEHNIDLRKCKPGDIHPSILPLVAKLHFKNVKSALSQ